MGGPYNIPRNYKGENKILFIFSTKAFIYTAVGAFIGVIFYFIFNSIKVTAVGVGFLLFFALLGFAIGTFKIPDTPRLKFTTKVGGESIDDVIIRYIQFKRKNKRIYVYKEEEIKDGEHK